MARLLLDTENVEPGSRNNLGQTPLLLAAESGSEEVARLLIDTYLVNPDHMDNRGRTPLLVAASKGDKAIVRLLLALGNVNPDHEDHFGRTPLSYAAEGIFFFPGEFVDTCNDNRKEHEAVVTMLLAVDSVDPYYKDRSGRTPLSYAAENGNGVLVKLLLDTGRVDPHCEDVFGKNAAVIRDKQFTP
ncbi:hypothetical protein VTN77DRAFT_957 [Rasamsonia byssochlamydoides]|uniref:uncharacterized protein n=1 Tax=Rasamsonia byssochlamydoides TaxID=89139 RepID=UPI0037444D31